MQKTTYSLSESRPRRSELVRVLQAPINGKLHIVLFIAGMATLGMCLVASSIAMAGAGGSRIGLADGGAGGYPTSKTVIWSKLPSHPTSMRAVSKMVSFPVIQSGSAQPTQVDFLGESCGGCLNGIRLAYPISANLTATVYESKSTPPKNGSYYEVPVADRAATEVRSTPQGWDQIIYYTAAGHANVAAVGWDTTATGILVVFDNPVPSGRALEFANTLR